MLKHQNIIENLTTEQKLGLIVDITSLKDIAIEGFKPLKSASLDSKETWQEYPSFSGLVNSWDLSLINQVSNEVLTKNRNDGVTLIELPNLGFKISPYSQGVSEDPLLAGNVAKEIVNAGNKNGVATCICAPFISKEDGEYMDYEFSLRMYNEFYNLPYKLIDSSKVNALKITKDEGEWTYSSANKDIEKLFSEEKVIIYNGCEKGSFVKKAVVEGKFFVNGCLESLEEAVENYEKLMDSFNNNEISIADVNRACDAGVAISPEMIDDAVDRILCFMDNCSTIPVAKKEKPVIENKRKKKVEKPLAVIAGEESIVLLKNKNDALPLKNKESVCLIGRLAEENGFKNYLEEQSNTNKITFNGYALGYNNGTDIGKDLLNEAVELAKKSSVVIMAVGLSEGDSLKARLNKNMRIPASQEALLNAVYKLGKKVILLVYGNSVFDTSFDKGASGVLVIPFGGSAVLEAMYNVLYGKGCPGGRLANTYYENTDEFFKSIKQNKDLKRNEIGIYHGYRLYTSLKEKVKYPFGFGLSYSNFRYLKFKIKNGVVTLKVKNKGKIEGSELIQIYVSKVQPKLMRPERELKAFFKVRLKPKEKKTITFKLTDLNLNVYYKKKDKLITESGEYEISICSNASEVKFSSKFYVDGENVKGKQFIRSRYLQSESNIKEGKYYFEEPVPQPKFAHEKTRKFMVGLSYFMAFLASIYFYLYFLKQVAGGVLEFILVGLAVALPIIIALSMKWRKNKFIKKCIAKNKIMKNENRSKLDFDLLCEEIPYEQLFVEEFDNAVIEIEKEKEQVKEDVKDEVFVNEVFNPEFTMSKAVEELTMFMKEKGIYVDVDSIRSLFASFASSRLLILNADDSELLNKFISYLSKYFKCDNVSLDYIAMREEGGDVINTMDGVTPIADALISDNNTCDGIRLMSINNVESGDVKSCLQQLIRYFEQPEKELTFSVLKDAKNYPISKNVWFILTLADGQKVIDIPRYLLESACVLELMMRPIEVPTNEKPVSVKNVEEKVVEESNNAEDEIANSSEEVDENIAAEEIETANTESEQVVEETEVTTESEQVVEETEFTTENEQVEEEVDVCENPYEVITYYQFSKMIDVARNKCILDETLWKRIDKLEDFIISVDKLYRINNKMWQRIEKYVSVYLNAGGSSEEAIDNVVAYYVINTMIPSVASGKNLENVKFTLVVENIFGEGHVPHSIKTIKSTGLKI